MNKSLLIQNGIAGGIAGTVADGLFNNEDEHHYAKSAFMGTLAGVGATALHQSIPSAAKAPAEHVPTPVANVPPAAPIAPTPQPAPAQPKPAATTPVQQQTAPQQPAAAPIVEQPKPAVVAPQPAAKPIEQPKPKPKPEPEPQPVEKAEATPAPKPIEQPKAVQPVQAEPVQQPAAAPSVEKQTERERIIEREPEARAQVEPKPAEQPKAVQPVQTEPVKPIQITPEKQPEPATQPVQQRRQKPVRPTPKVVRNEPKPEEFVGPHDQSKLTKTINSVKQSASNVGNGILEGAKNIVATASKLKIPPIELNISGAGKQITQAGRSIASGLARSAQALSIAAIASMDMGGGHAVVQHAFEAASHSVQVQASMATSTMTKAVNNITEAVGNYHPMQGVENAINDMQYIPKAAENTVTLPKVIQPVEEPKTANVELLVGGPYKDKVTGETHPYGHVALVVHGHMPDKTKYSKVYDYGRYGKHSGPYGEGILREWNDPTKYINSENLTGRTTTGFTYPASEQEAQNIVKHFESLKSGSKLLSSGKKGNLVPNNVYKLNHDYDAANSNCVTVSLGGLISGMPKLGNRLNSPAFEQLSTLSKVEQLGMQAAHNTNLLMLPASLKFAATKVGGAKTSMYSASSAKRSAPKLANIPVKPKKSAAKLTTNVNAVKTPNA